jgi:hypothetical protein
MNRKWLGKWFGIPVLVAASAVLVSLPSCGRDQELASISILPSSETFGASNIQVIDDQGLSVQLKAVGSYVHPAVIKDITNQVTWASDSPNLATVSSTGVVTATGFECGGAIISATVQTNHNSVGQGSTGAIVVGLMTTNVVCFTGTGGGGGPALTVTFGGAGTGTVTSNPVLFNCISPSPCVASFPSNSTVMLTATPDPGSSFGSWGSCDSSASTNPCSVTMTANRTVTVTLN